MADLPDRLLRLSFRPPYDWQHASAFLAARALPGIERVDSDGYARTIATPRGHAIVRVRPIENASALELRVRGAAPAELFHISSVARRMFDVSADPAAIALALRTDGRLRPLVDARPGLRIPGVWDPFECAVRAVLGQQVSVAAGRTLAMRVVARAGRALTGAGEGLTHLFPTAAALATADLGGLGITGGRIGALHALARAVASGAVDLHGTVGHVTAALVALPCIGYWTAQYVALRALGEPDAFPREDLILRRAASRTSQPLTARQLEERAEAWRPWRGDAVLHLWAAAANARSEERCAHAMA